VPHYEKYTTTVIGAHSVPQWYEAMDRLVSSGQLAPGDFIDAQLRARKPLFWNRRSRESTFITGGEMHRRTHNRHSPPNAQSFLAENSCLSGRDKTQTYYPA
jgi:5-methyltetrahydropteroyltriglutamate--homocysteine methyltransferase